MKQAYLFILPFTVFWVFFSCQTSNKESLAEINPWKGLAEGWNTIRPGGETLCGTGTEFLFHVRPADPQKILVYLNGGGACWSGELCSLDIEPVTYTPFADQEYNDPRNFSGIFDFENPENPFIDWTILFVPYCTGDVHLGSFDKKYITSEGQTVNIFHRGKANVQSVMEWLFGKIEKPEGILITGSSAGSVAVPYYAMLTADHYPNSKIIALGDGSGGYRDKEKVSEVARQWGIFANLPDWVEVKKMNNEDLDFEDLYRLAFAHQPNIRFAQINSAYDKVQEDFLKLMGNNERLYSLLKDNMNDLESEIPNFVSFTFGGNEHTVLRSDRFYNQKVKGVTVVDWVKSLIQGKELKSLDCGTGLECESSF